MRKLIKDIPIRSIFHLFLVRGSIYLFPFITLPVITKSLGVSNFGILSIFLAAQQYMIMLVEYGFTLTGSRDIARAENKKQEQNVVTEIIYCRSLMFLLCVICVGAGAILTKYNENTVCYFIMIVSIFSTIFNQSYFFIGKEKTGFIVISSTISRILSIIFVLFFVKNKNDIDFAMLAYSFNIIIPNILSILYMVCKLNFSLFIRTTSIEIKKRFKSGFDIFISNVFTNIYSSLTLVYLGFAKNPIESGYYSSADKLKGAAQGVLYPIAQAFFPRISKVDSKDFFKLWFKSSCILVSFAIVLVMILILLSDYVYKIFLGAEFISGISVYYALSLSIISISFGIAFAQNLYLVRGQTKILRTIYLVVSVLHLAYMPLLVHIYGALGAALSVLLTETMASILMFIFRKRCYICNQV
ncbi:hypothetical protein CHU32_00725 [Superficieibacter electus]|uniref:Putative O-antigen transporter n=1 Tax=Superficieibacter electus TaxID=2022662 RepID=A0A2P5GVZ4_9ENTR|nr:oligosaccharide flippase family protein [Superficieibacter electus]POP47702.1 hypothetical protein CHU33_00725 [Superficieibacter electus]POP50713.1 hypothetical protein CHU32_00725 [Superficieibacter electus]